MSEEKQSFISKIGIQPLLAVIAIIGIGYTTYYQVGVLLKDNEKVNATISTMHDDIDVLKIRIVQELYDVKIEAMEGRHELENKINEEKIERLESNVEFYKKK